MNQQAIPEMIDWCRKLGYEVCGSPLHSHPQRHHLADKLKSQKTSTRFDRFM